MELIGPAKFDFLNLSQKNALNPNFKNVKKFGGAKMTFFLVCRKKNSIRHNSAYIWNMEMFKTIFRILRPSAFR